MPSEKLAGRVALVTGAGKRIGRSIALALAREGAGVAVNYNRTTGGAQETAAEIAAMGRPSAAIQADVTRRGDVERMFAAVDAQFGRLDILVNNAGAFFPVPFEQITDEQWDGILASNLKSQFLCAQAAVPMMKRQGSGRIINLSSLGGMLAWPGYTHYCVSTAGFIML